VATEQQITDRKAMLESSNEPTSHGFLPREFGQIFLNTFLALYKAAVFYDYTNIIIGQLGQECMKIIESVFETYGYLNVKIVRDAAFLNNNRIQVTADSYAQYKIFTQEMRRMRLGDIEFSRGLTEPKLRAFVYMLHRLEANNESNYLVVKKQLAQEEIPFIDVSKLEYYQSDLNYIDSEDRKRRSKEVYGQTIDLVKELMEGSSNKKVLHVRKAKRLMLNTVKMIALDDSTLLGMTNIKSYDDYTFNHSVNVAIYAISLGQRIGITKKQLNYLGMAALFHDIGKTDIDKNVLNKTDKLTPEEWAEIQTHPLRGAESILHLRGWSELAARMVAVAFEHHLRYDQSGYPKLMRTRTLSLFSRIVTIVDCYDAMGRPRIYRKSRFLPDKIVQMMLERSGTDFDPVLVKVFVNMIGLYPLGTLVELDNGEMGVVCKIPEDPLLLDHPQICLVHQQDGNYQRGEIINLADTDPDTGAYYHSIVRTLDPDDYAINVEGFFL